MESGVEQSAIRLLEAINELADGRPDVGIPLEESAGAAGMDPQAPATDVALRYLLNHSYIKDVTQDNTRRHELNAPGIERLRELRGLPGPPPPQTGRSSVMSDKMQRRLVTLLAIGIAMGLSRPLTRYITEQIPERRGMRDDITEAVLQGVVRSAAILGASILVRQLARRRR